MGKKITTTDFIAKSIDIHGNRYLYHNTTYKSAKLHVTITCPIEGHGDFICTPSNHTHKSHARGCPVCGKSKPLTWETFVNKSKQKHGDTFKYPIQKIVNAKTHVRLICTAVGHEIWQTPDSNLSGSGCRKCADLANGLNSRVSENEVNKRLNLLCQDSDNQVVLLPESYEGMNSKAQIVCSEHGIQPARLMTTILSGNPCLECSQTANCRGYSTNQFVRVLENHFNNRYEIKPFTYQGKETLLELVCKSHGVFSLLAGSIYRSPGCRKCAYADSLDLRKRALQNAMDTTREKRFKEWLQLVKSFHDDRYSYENVIYLTQKTPVEITCSIHGGFWQLPDTHKTSGCMDCKIEDSKGRYTETYFSRYPEEKNRPALLYYLRFSFRDEVFFKIGITTTTIKKRFSMALANGFSITTLNLLDTTLHQAFQLEQLIQNEHGDYHRQVSILDNIDPREMRLGRSECFSTPLSEEAENRLFS